MALYLDVDKRECNNRKACIKKVLKALNKREKGLKKMIAAETNAEKRAEMEEDMAIIHRKRKKGLKALRELKKESSDEKKS